MTPTSPRFADPAGRPPDAQERHIALVGLMGAGKSAVGEAIAVRLDRPFVDLDREIERRVGRTVREMFEAEGEAPFRVAERRTLAEVLGRSDAAVIATGGGVVLDAANRQLLERSAVVVWLRVTPAVAARRVGPDADRPLLGSDPAAALEDLAAVRAGLYAEVAHVVADVDEATVEEAAAAVLTAISSR